MGCKWKQEGQLESSWGSDFPGDSGSKVSVCKAGVLGSIPELPRSPGEGNGNPLQYSCLENSMHRGAWRGHRESDTTERLTLVLGWVREVTVVLRFGGSSGYGEKGYIWEKNPTGLSDGQGVCNKIG